MKLAVLFDEKIESGGGFQQSISEVIEASQKKLCELFIFTTKQENVRVIEELGLACAFVKLSVFSKLVIELRRNLFFLKLFRRFCKHNKFEAFLFKNDVDLVYFVSPCPLAYACENINFIFTIWDMAHRDCVELPEVRDGREIERRDHLYIYACSKATALVVDSQEAKALSVRRYLIDEARVFVKYFLPSYFLKSVKADNEWLQNQGMKPDFLFYPAQFWPHKNHIVILEALRKLKSQGVRVDVVFSGGDRGGKKFIESKVKEYDLEAQVYFLGFISSEQLRACYENCCALIMPTLFGPSNIPPLEAYMFNRPIIYTFPKSLLECVSAYENCYPIAWNDVDSVVEAIKKVLALGPVEKRINGFNVEGVLGKILQKFMEYQNLYK